MDGCGPTAGPGCKRKSVNEGGTSVRSGTASVSRFGAVVRLRHRGLYRALIKVTDDGGHVSNHSEPILIR